MHYKIIFTLLSLLIYSLCSAAFAYPSQSVQKEQDSLEIVRNINQNLNKPANTNSSQELLRNVKNNANSASQAKEKNQKLVDQINYNLSRNKADLPPVLSEAMKNKPTNLFTASQSDFSAKNNSGILIFISSSMPKIALENYFREAKKYGATLLIRGFVGDSLSKTYTYIKDLSTDGVGIGIDPNSFDKFAVTQVPSIVVYDPNSDCASKGCTPKHDRITGNITLKYALHKIANEGEFGKKQSILSLQNAGEGGR